MVASSSLEERCRMHGLFLPSLDQQDGKVISLSSLSKSNGRGSLFLSVYPSFTLSKRALGDYFSHSRRGRLKAKLIPPLFRRREQRASLSVPLSKKDEIKGQGSLSPLSLVEKPSGQGYPPSRETTQKARCSSAFPSFLL